MSKLVKIENINMQYPNEYKISSTKRGTSKLEPAFGAVTGGSLISAETTNEIQKNGVLSVSGIRQANATKDVYLVDIPGIDEFGTYDGMKLVISFDQTNTTNLVYISINSVEYQIENISIGDVVINRIYFLEMKNDKFINIIPLVATQAEVDTGVEDTKIVTSKKLKSRLDTLLASITTNFVKLTQLATETKAGIVTEARIKEIAPKPDLTSYVPFSKGFRNQSSTDWFVRTNGRITWASDILEMWNGDNNQFMGAFHTNGSRAYYKVPNRNGGNWLEIMDNIDMAARDNNIQHAHNRITETWDYAVNANGRFNWSNVYNSNSYIASGGSIAAVPANWNEIVIYYKVGSDTMRGTVTFVKGGYVFVHNNGGLHIELRGTVLYSIGSNTGTVMQIWVRV